MKKYLILLLIIPLFTFGQTSQTFLTSGNFVVPAGVTSITVQAWGGGGCSGENSGGKARGGGGGGAYTSGTITVTPGTTISVTVGAGGIYNDIDTATDDGGSSSVGVIVANGGLRGLIANNAVVNGGLGGAASTNPGGVVSFLSYTGGNGGSGKVPASNTGGGGGGESGSSTGIGFNGSSSTSNVGGTGGTGNAGGGDGGRGSDDDGSPDSENGIIPGGGAGGRGDSNGSNRNGGAGQVIITFSCPTYSLTSVSVPSSKCISAGTTTTVTLNSTAAGLPVGTYTVTYSRNDPSATGLTATMTVTTAGTGTFTATGLTTPNNTNTRITVTNLSSVSCSNAITSSNVSNAFVMFLTPTPTATIVKSTCSNNSNGSIRLTAPDAAVEFKNADSDYIDLGAGYLSSRTAFTIEGWIKFKSADLAGLTNVGLFGQNDVIEFGFSNSTTILFYTSAGNDYHTMAIGTLGDNNWHHIAAVGDGTNKIIYIDGVSVGTKPLGSSNYGTSIYTAKIGAQVFHSTGGGFTGQIKKVGFYSTALSSTTIASLASSPTTYSGSETGLLAGYNFSDGTGTTLAKLPTGTNGTFVNSPEWNYTYSWTKTGTPGFSATTRNISNLSPGDYNLTLSTLGTGCPVTTTFTVGYKDLAPTEPVVGAIIQPICTLPTGTVTLNGLPEGSWELTRTPGAIKTMGSGTTTTVSGLASGTYTFSVINKGLKGEYFSGNQSLSGAPTFTRIDSTVDFNLNTTQSPNPAMPTFNRDIFSARWTGFVQPLYSQTYTFKTISNDGIRLWVNGVQIINNWTTHSSTTDTGTIALTAGVKYTIVLEYYQDNLSIVNRLFWSSASQIEQIIPAAVLNPDDACSSPESVNVVINPTLKIWNGTAWTPTGSPTEHQDIQFTGNYSQAVDINACKCTVTTGTVTIPSGNYLKLGGKLTVNAPGTLTFENNASLVQTAFTAANEGSINYKRNYTGGETDYTYWSSPVATQNLLAVSPLTKLDKFFSFDDVAENWLQLDAPTTTMSLGKGYIIRGIPPPAFPALPPGFGTATFRGVANNGNVPITVASGVKSNLIGNPYPSAIAADQFIFDNQAAIDGTIYLWTHNTPIAVGTPDPGTGGWAYSGNDYAAYSLTGGVGTAGNKTPEWVDANKNGIIDSGEFTDKNGNGTLNTGEWTDSNGNLTVEVGEWTDTNGNYIADITNGEWTDLDSDGIVDLPSEWIDTNNDGIRNFGEWTDTNANGIFNTGEWNDSNSNKRLNLEVEQVSNRPTGIIAAGQSFFTTSTLAGGTVTFTNSMRVDGSSNPLNNSNFYKTKEPKNIKSRTFEKHRIWLNLTNKEGAFKQTLLGYITGATNSWDRLYDGETFDGNDFLDFYTINEDLNLTIQGRSLPFDDNEKIPLGYRIAMEGTFTINIDETDGFLSNHSVFLEDKLSNTLINLKNEKYVFSSVAGTFNDRFVLHFRDKTLGTDSFVEKNNAITAVFSSNSQSLIIRNNLTDVIVNEVTLFNLLGQKISNWNVKNKEQTSIQIPIKNVAKEIYIVKIVTTNGEFSIKISIK